MDMGIRAIRRMGMHRTPMNFTSDSSLAFVQAFVTDPYPLGPWVYQMWPPKITDRGLRPVSSGSTRSIDGISDEGASA